MYDPRDNEIMKAKGGSKSVISAVDHSKNTILEAMQKMVDPVEIVARLMDIMRDNTATDKDRLAAMKLIMERREGMPVATVMNIQATKRRRLEDLSTEGLMQIHGILAKEIEAGDFEDADEVESE